MISGIFVRQGGLLEEVGISLGFRITFERKKGWCFAAKAGKGNEAEVANRQPVCWIRPTDVLSLACT